MQFDIRRFDIYRKVPKDLTQPTLTGACISIFSILFIAFLFFSELLLFVTTEVVSELYVDDPVQHSEKIPVFLNISIMKMPCKFLGLDIQDEMGRHEVGMSESTEKFPLDGENGCRLESHFLVNKVPGNFHVSTHASREQPQQPDMSHHIHEVRFGMEIREKVFALRGSFNPLHKMEKIGGKAFATHDYIIRIVPSVYQDIRNNVHFPYQYTFSYREMVQYSHGGMQMPAVWFRYDMSPITVKYEEKRKPFYTFLTTVCAIVGGTFTVAGILDSFIFTASEIIKKAEMGKLS